MLALTGAATGCFLKQSDDVGSSGDEVVSGAEASLLLKSTLVLDAGCLATKVGPRQLLLSARCVSENKAAFTKGKVLGYTTANNAGARENVLAPAGADSGSRDSGTTTTSTDAGGEGDAEASDAGSTTTTTDAGHASDAGATPIQRPGSSRIATIADVNVHRSWESKCGTGTPAEICGFNQLEASDAADVALIVLEQDLEGIASIPVDLDPVGQSDSLLVIASGCEIVGAEEAKSIATKKTIAVPQKSANHKGSPYNQEPAKIGTLSASYFVTAGPGWRKTEPGVCASDFGAPVFRGGVGAVAGVTSNFTEWSADTFVPVTVEHTRLDATSRFKIGNWLESLGADVIHSCGEAAGGCPKRDYDGGAPVPPSAGPVGDTTGPGDGGGDVIAPKIDGGKSDGGGSSDDGGVTEPGSGGPMTGQQEQLSDNGPPEDTYAGGDSDYADAAAPKKKKSSDSGGGCSAAPGSTPTGGMGLVFGVGLAVMAIGRRRRASK